MKTSDVEFVERAEAVKPLPQSLRVFVGTAAALLFVAGVTEGVCRYVLRLGNPYNSPLLNEHFPDILTLQPRFQHFHTLQFFTDTQDPLCMYPAPVAVCYRALFAFIPHEVPVFLSFVVLSFLVATLLFGRSLIRGGLSSGAVTFLLGFSLVTSYPLWFMMKQANMEIFSWTFMALGLWAFMRNRGYSAAACFGIAGALKVLPFFYLGLFLAKRQYRHILVAILAAISVTIPSLWLVYPHIAESWRLTGLEVAKFRTVVTLKIYPQIGFDHSVFGFLKRIAFRHIDAHHLSLLLTAYSVMAAVFMLAIFFGRIRKLPVINQVLCLCVATLTVPPTSFDYTLSSLYLPWALLVLLVVQERAQDRIPSGAAPAMICFAILFVPETELVAHHVSVGGQIKALTLIALFLIALRIRLPELDCSEGDPA